MATTTISSTQARDYTFNGGNDKTPSPTSLTPHTPWHSPVPYLFGGLAAMLGLVAVALLILACSYWRLSGHLDRDDQNHDRDLEAGEKGGNEKVAVGKVMEEMFLVTMAGDVRPSFLATPMTSRSSFFADGGNNTACSCSTDQKFEGGDVKKLETSIHSSSGGDHVSMNSHDESSDQTQI